MDDKENAGKREKTPTSNKAQRHSASKEKTMLGLRVEKPAVKPKPLNLEKFGKAATSLGLQDSHRELNHETNTALHETQNDGHKYRAQRAHTDLARPSGHHSYDHERHGYHRGQEQLFHDHGHHRHHGHHHHHEHGHRGAQNAHDYGHHGHHAHDRGHHAHDRGHHGHHLHDHGHHAHEQGHRGHHHNHDHGHHHHHYHQHDYGHHGHHCSHDHGHQHSHGNHELHGHHHHDHSHHASHHYGYDTHGHGHNSHHHGFHAHPHSETSRTIGGRSRRTYSTVSGDHRHYSGDNYSVCSACTDIAWENTYKTEPDDGVANGQIRKIILDVLKERLQDKQYDPLEMQLESRAISDIIKDKVKALRLYRFKLVCLIYIGQDKKQSVQIGSRCLWDHRCDSFATATLRFGDFYATGMVFATYFE